MPRMEPQPPLWHWWMIALQKTLQAILDYKPPESEPGPAHSAKISVKTGAEVAPDNPAAPTS
jgi:hypothetical protein